ncbi:MAG: hypothetical protein HGA36_03470 [Candidatus Moranbacteria bacterium]|nr:hypothetical protein [Candidatus Moranbacteria bacterium]
MRRLQILATRYLTPSIFNNVLFKSMYLLKQSETSDDLKTFSLFITQALNFFIINPMGSEVEARQQIEMILANKEGRDKEAHEILHEKSFNPAELIAGVAFLFRQIFLLHFTKRGFIEEQDFQFEVVRAVMNSHELTIGIFPETSKQFDLFMKYFEENYLSPWNPVRYSDQRSRANFGTGVDYIMQ